MSLQKTIGRSVNLTKLAKVLGFVMKFKNWAYAIEL